jgi:hypothetical protein
MQLSGQKEVTSKEGMVRAIAKKLRSVRSVINQSLELWLCIVRVALSPSQTFFTLKLGECRHRKRTARSI